jgi:hypothetical protein
MSKISPTVEVTVTTTAALYLNPEPNSIRQEGCGDLMNQMNTRRMSAMTVTALGVASGGAPGVSPAIIDPPSVGSAACGTWAAG